MLIVAPNWLGDAVMALPFVRALRKARPGDSLTVVARRGPAAIFRAEGSADGVWVASGLLSDAVTLARGRVDEAWLLPNSFRSALLPFLARVPERIGYATDARTMLLTHAVPRPAGTAHQLRDYDRLLASRGVPPDMEPPRLPIPGNAAERARRAIAAAGLPGGAPLVLLAPAAASGSIKKWPASRFAVCFPASSSDRAKNAWAKTSRGAPATGRSCSARISTRSSSARSCGMPASSSGTIPVPCTWRRPSAPRS
jgi:heptosyltransferase-2